MRSFPQNERGEGEHFPVGRPGDSVWSLLEIGDARDLARVHPANVNLLFAIGIGVAGQAKAVRGPARGRVTATCGGERAMVGSVGTDEPEILVAVVSHATGTAAHIDD